MTNRIVSANLTARKKIHVITGTNKNASMNPRLMKAHCQLNAEINGYLEHAMEEMNFSARAHDRILKVTMAAHSRPISTSF